MCSYLFARTATQLTESALQTANKYACYRGPDKTRVVQQQDRYGYSLTFLHNLLDISGTSCVQPIIDANFANLTALFNGEIYNFRQLTGGGRDTDCILPTYVEFGKSAGQYFDGEFAITLYDCEKNSLFIFTDPFLTKPLYWGTNDARTAFGVATCGSSLRAIGCHRTELFDPNATYEVNFSPDGFAMKCQREVRPFRLEQHKNDYTDWGAAFIDSVRKRASHGAHRPMVFLSSGYDSGAICVALNHLEIGYDTFSIVAGEHRGILEKRIRINRAHSCGEAFCVESLSETDLQRMTEDIGANVEPFVYVHEDKPGVICDLRTDGGALGANYLAELARHKNRLVNLSGSGADEIMSDYGFAGKKFYHHSEFGGLFPDDLESIFPWKKFYGDTQRSYLFKDEYTLGRHGIEGRYPFLDWKVVQEFLALKPDLKNKSYKGAIGHLLSLHDYPYEPMKKRGFSPSAGTQILEQNLPVKRSSLTKSLIRRFRRFRQ